MSVVFLLSMIDLDSYRLIIDNRPTGAGKRTLSFNTHVKYFITVTPNG